MFDLLEPQIVELWFRVLHGESGASPFWAILCSGRRRRVPATVAWRNAFVVLGHDVPVPPNLECADEEDDLQPSEKRHLPNGTETIRGRDWVLRDERLPFPPCSLR